MTKESRNNRKTGLLITLLLLAAILGVGAYILFKDMTPPVVSLSPPEGWISPSTEFVAGAQDLGSGLRSLEVTLIQNGKAQTIYAKEFPQKDSSASASFTIDKDRVKDGNFTIQVTARDGALTKWGKGTPRTISQSYAYDSAPPDISMDSSVHNIRQGGSGCVAYTLSEEPESTGVLVGETLYPGHKQPSGVWVALYPFPYNMTASEFSPAIVATDMAGNSATRDFGVHARESKFRFDRLNVPDSFLIAKAPEFRRYFPDESNPLQLYLKANTELRRQNAEALRELSADTAPQQLWEGSFVRMMGATRSKFGDKRDYYYGENLVDKQTHLGVDIAQTLHSPIPAANAGRIVFTGDLGIYGNAVVIDHGLGLQTLYSHMSQIEVKPGDLVQRKQIIGKTGMTGLAGGDHLHFGILVGGMPVTPVEWWDGKWIANNITGKYAE